MRKASLIVAAHALFLAERASAAPPNVRLTLLRPEDAQSCLDERALERAVEERVQRRVFDAAKPAELSLSVRYSAKRPWTVDVTLADREGTLGSRTLTSPARHCSALDDSLALVVALLVDTPAAQAPRVAPAPPATGAQPQKTQGTPLGSEARRASIVVPEGTLAPRAPFEFDVRAAAAGLLGVQPSFAPGFTLGFGVRPPRGPWLRASAELYAATERERGTGRVRVASRRLGLDVCSAGYELGRFFAFSGCVGQRLGQLRVQGEGFDVVSRDSRFYYALVAGGQGLIPLGSLLGLFLGVDVEIPLTRERFTARPDGVQSVELQRAGPVGASTKAGLQVAF